MVSEELILYLLLKYLLLQYKCFWANKVLKYYFFLDLVGVFNFVLVIKIFAIFSSFGGIDFILNDVEIESDSFKLNSSEYETECNSFPSSEDEGFLDDDSCCGEDIKQDPSFYRTFDNRKEFSTFKNQIKNPVEASKRSEDNYYKEDDMPELFTPEQRGDVKFHTFQNDKEKALNFKKSLQCFIIEHENQFFYAVVYGLMYHKMENQTPISKISIEHAEKVLRRDLCFKLKKTEPDVMLDYTIFGFFD